MSHSPEPRPLPRPSDFRCLDPLRVRWAEVDLQKIVFNGHYLMYFDTAVAAYWRQMGMPYHEAMHALGGDLYVRKATLEYEASARYDDQLNIGMRLQRMGTRSMTLQACAFKGTRALVHGEIVYVFADPATQTSLPIPERLRSWIQAFEDRRPVIRIQTGSHADLGAQASPLRNAVFVQEQGVDVRIESDGLDDAARHVVAHNWIGQAVGTGRLVVQDDRTGKIGRMAVIANLRGAGVGRLLLEALCEEARRLGLGSVVLHAQLPAVGFYARQGFEVCSARFEEAGIEHCVMRRAWV